MINLHSTLDAMLANKQCCFEAKQDVFGNELHYYIGIYILHTCIVGTVY